MSRGFISALLLEVLFGGDGVRFCSRWLCVVLGMISPIALLVGGLTMVIRGPELEKHLDVPGFDWLKNLVYRLWEFEWTDVTFWSCHVELIDPGIRNLPVLASFGKLDEKELSMIRQEYEFLTQRDSMVVLVFSVIFSTLFLGPHVGIVVLLCGFVMKMSGAHENSAPVMLEEGFLEPFSGQEGVYAIKSSFLGMGWKVGTGVLWDGVFHTCYHVTRGSPVSDGRYHRKARYIGKETDLVTYGGMPKVDPPRDGDKILTRVTGKRGIPVIAETVYHESDDKLAFFQTFKTSPGDSGSPFFRVDENGVLQLAGVMGTSFSKPRNSDPVWDHEGVHVEVVVPYEKRGVKDLVRLVGGTVQQVFQPPGSGKTRDLIPHIMKDAIVLNKMVIISPPTRAICVEVSHNLKEMGYIISEEFMGGRRMPNSMVRIMPHAVLASRISVGDIFFKDTIFIVDETHSTDARSQFALHYLRNLCNADGRNPKSPHCLIELTATGFDLATCEPRICMDKDMVVDIRKDLFGDRYSGLCETIRSNMGKRIVIFCGSVLQTRGHLSSILTLEKILDTIPGLRIVKFHRKSFGTALEEIREKEPGETLVVLTTNMSEVGVNLDVDVCIDFQQQLRFQAKCPGSPIFEPCHGQATQSQIVQRRGRVGRGKKGVYYFQTSLESDVALGDGSSVEDYDAAVAASTFSLRPVLPLQGSLYEGIKLSLSMAQLSRWFSGSELRGTIATYLAYDEFGRPRSEKDRFNIGRMWSLHPRARVVRLKKNSVRTPYFDARDREFLAKYLQKVNADLYEVDSTDEDLGAPKLRRNCVVSNKARISDEDHVGIRKEEPHTHQCSHCDHAYTHSHERMDRHELICECCIYLYGD